MSISMSRRSAGRPGLQGTRERRPTAAEEVAGLIRENIFLGNLEPGAQLTEHAVSEQFSASRNTVREVFRTLMAEGLLAYQVHRGVSVRSLTAADVEEIYIARERLTILAVNLLIQREGALNLAALEKCVTSAERAAKEGEWADVGTDNLRFHQELVAVLGSRRLSAFFEQLMVEMRLGFLAVQDAEALHAPYLLKNREIYDLLAEEKYEDAKEKLQEYLAKSRHEITEAVERAMTS